MLAVAPLLGGRLGPVVVAVVTVVVVASLGSLLVGAPVSLPVSAALGGSSLRLGYVIVFSC